ncbi:anti-sigma regulatory factor [Deinococcus pimensis]|uniref:anti-sigma regulatory factor n=1 Tax=Deinococcus pimensis TaxID=309888 RepID=UPI00048A27B3|nr:anti-sigma regulatory factor [Deinococcus pimensis]
MTATPDTLPIHSEDDVVRVRHAVRRAAVELGFSLVDQTKLVTAASELARNTLIHGGGGEARVERLDTPRRGLRLVFEDRGPGIPDVERAFQDGFTTGGGLGLGLGGSRRLVNDFSVESTPGVLTRVTATKWK